MNLGDPPNPHNLQKFIARCEVRALLWQIGEFDEHPNPLAAAVDELEVFGRGLGLDTELAQFHMGRAFAALRDDLGGWRP